MLFEELAYNILSNASDPKKAKEDLLFAYYSEKEWADSNPLEVLQKYGQYVDQYFKEVNIPGKDEIESLTGAKVENFLSPEEYKEVQSGGTTIKGSDIVDRWEQYVADLLETSTDPLVMLNKDAIRRGLPQAASNERRRYNTEFQSEDPGIVERGIDTARSMIQAVPGIGQALTATEALPEAEDVVETGQAFAAGASDFLGFNTWYSAFRRNILGEANYDFRKRRMEFVGEPDSTGEMLMQQGASAAGNIGGLIASTIAGPIGIYSSIVPRAVEETVDRYSETKDITGVESKALGAASIEAGSQLLQLFGDKFLLSGPLKAKAFKFEAKNPLAFGALVEGGTEAVGQQVSESAEAIQYQQGIFDRPKGWEQSLVDTALSFGFGAIGGAAVKGVFPGNASLDRKQEVETIGRPVTAQDSIVVNQQSTIKPEEDLVEITPMKELENGDVVGKTTDGKFVVKDKAGKESERFDYVFDLDTKTADEVLTKVQIEGTHVPTVEDGKLFLVDPDNNKQEVPTSAGVDSRPVLVNKPFTTVDRQKQVELRFGRKYKETSLGAAGPIVEVETRPSKLSVRMQESPIPFVRDIASRIQEYTVLPRTELQAEAIRYLETNYDTVVNRFNNLDQLGVRPDLGAAVYTEYVNSLYNYANTALQSGNVESFNNTVDQIESFINKTLETYVSSQGRAVDYFKEFSIARNQFRLVNQVYRTVEKNSLLDQGIDPDALAKEEQTVDAEITRAQEEVAVINQQEESILAEEAAILDEQIKSTQEEIQDRTKEKKPTKRAEKKLSKLKEQRQAVTKPVSEKKLELANKIQELNQKKKQLTTKRAKAKEVALKAANEVTALSKRIQDLEAEKKSLGENSSVVITQIDPELTRLKQEQEFLSQANLSQPEKIRYRYFRMMKNNFLTGLVGAGIITTTAPFQVAKFFSSAVAGDILSVVPRLKGKASLLSPLESLKFIEGFFSVITNPTSRKIFFNNLKTAFVTGRTLKPLVESKDITGDSSITTNPDVQQLEYALNHSDYFEYVKALKKARPTQGALSEQVWNNIKKNVLQTGRPAKKVLETLESLAMYPAILSRAYAVMDVMLGTPTAFAAEAMALEYARKNLGITEAQYALLKDRKSRWQRSEDFVNAKVNDLKTKGIEVDKENRYLMIYEQYQKQLPDPVLLDTTKMVGEVTFNTPTDGVSGKIGRAYAGLMYSSNTPAFAAGAMFALSPFVNPVFRIIQQNAQFVPGIHLLGGNLGETALQKRTRHTAGLTGALVVASMATALTYFSEDKDENGNPWFDIIGARYSKDKEKNEAFKNVGGKPFSLKFGNTYVQFGEGSLAALFGIVGAYTQAKRDGLNPSEGLAGLLAASMLSGVDVITNLSMMQTVGGLLDSVGKVTKEYQNNGSISESAVVSLISPFLSSAKALVPGIGLQRSINRFFESPIDARKDIASALVDGIVGLQGLYGKPSLNVFGEPIPPKIRNQNGDITIDPGIHRIYSQQTTLDVDMNYLIQTEHTIPNLYAIPLTKTEEKMLEREGLPDKLSYEIKYKIAKEIAPEIREAVQLHSRIYGKAQATDKSQEKLNTRINNIYRRKLREYIRSGELNPDS